MRARGVLGRHRMKKKPSKPLKLNRETLKPMTNENLKKAAGGSLVGCDSTEIWCWLHKAL